MELMSPVNNMASLIAALDNGADSVFFGLKHFNMRVNAKNFELNQLKNITKLVHSRNKKCYLTLNTIIYDAELELLEQIIQEAKKNKVDSIICWDPAVIRLANKYKIPINISTQASISNLESVKFYEQLGAKQIVLARELSLKQIKNISENTSLDIEVFAHGAMCVSISGRCFLSQFLFNKSANRGECLQPCRRQYDVIDKQTGDKLSLNNHFILSPKDLSTLSILPKLKEAGIKVLKLEGRNRSPEYIAMITKVYRSALDYTGNNYSEFIKPLLSELNTVYNRKFHTGFLEGTPTSDDWTDVYGNNSKVQKIYVGTINKFYNRINVAEIKLVSELNIGDKISIQGNKTGVFEQVVLEIEKNNGRIFQAKKHDHIGIKLLKPVRPNDKVFLLKTLH